MAPPSTQKPERLRRSAFLTRRLQSDDLPFPEGLPNTDNPVECLIHSLSVGRYAADQLARVDDFIIRAAFEPKYANRKAPRDTDAQKWIPQGNLSSRAAIEVCQAWCKVKVGPLNTWTEGAQKIWVEVLLKMMKDGNVVGSLRQDDGNTFSSLLVRYFFIYHTESPIKLCVVHFPGNEAGQRGIEAKKSISKGDFILEASGIVSIDSSSTNLSRFSIIQHKGRHRTYEAILVGPIRFANHHCKPNCQIWNMLDLRDAGMSPSEFYTLRALRHISVGEEITVNYGKTYFSGADSTCLCSACVLPNNRALNSQDPQGPPRPRMERKQVGKKAHRGRRKLRADEEA